MTRRENRRTRRAPVREERAQVLIVCGGASTEPAYFRGLKKERRNPAVRVVVDAKGVDPVSLVRFAAQKRDTMGFDQVWCVVDVDEFDVSEAIPLTCFDDVRSRLVRHLPRYDKSKLCFEDFGPAVDDAVRHARSRCDEVGTEHTRNPRPTCGHSSCRWSDHCCRVLR